jgi:putative ABC transport system permease protein
VSGFRYGVGMGAEGKRRFIVAVDPDTVADVVELDMISGSVSSLEDGGVLVRESEADDLGIGIGDSLAMTFGNTGTQRVPVTGIFGDYREDSYLLSMKTYEDNFARRDDIQLYLTVAPGVSLRSAEAAVGEALEPFPNVQVLNQAGFREESSQMIDQMLNLVFALLALALLIAILGITNTLALSVFERKRELGLLRAVGATKGQVRRMIRWEAATIALFGTALGVAIGIAFGWALISALADEGFSNIVVPLGHVAAFVVVAGLAGLLAAVLPARRAARVDVLEAIAFE